MTSARWWGGGGSEKLTKVDVIFFFFFFFGGCPYKVDINHDTPKGWGKEENEEKLHKNYY